MLSTPRERGTQEAILAQIRDATEILFKKSREKNTKPVVDKMENKWPERKMPMFAPCVPGQKYIY